MAKNILAFFGLVFLTLIIVVGVVVMGYLYDSFGLVALPGPLKEPLAKIPQSITVIASDRAFDTVEWSNPLDLIPSATEIPQPEPVEVPTPTSTPIPPMDPTVYRSEVIIRLKRFVGALETWMQLNDRLAANRDLLTDPAWRNDAGTALDRAAAESIGLAEVGPPPAEYQGIAELLKRVSVNTIGLRDQYRHALDTGNTDSFKAAGEHFSQLKAYLTQAVDAMVSAGWSLK